MFVFIFKKFYEQAFITNIVEIWPSTDLGPYPWCSIRILTSWVRLQLGMSWQYLKKKNEYDWFFFRSKPSSYFHNKIIFLQNVYGTLRIHNFESTLLISFVVYILKCQPKLYIPSALNTDLIFWQLRWIRNTVKW